MTVCVPVTPPGSGVTETLYARITSAPGECACMLNGVSELTWAVDSRGNGSWNGTMQDLCDVSLTWTVRLRWVVGMIFTIYLDRDDACFAANCTATATDDDPVTIVFTNFNVPENCCNPLVTTLTRDALVVTIGEAIPDYTDDGSIPGDHTGETESEQRHCITAFAVDADGWDNSNCSAAPTSWTAYTPTSSIGSPLSRLGVAGGGFVLGAPPPDDLIGVDALDLAATSALIPAGGETCWLWCGGIDFSALQDTEGWDVWKFAAHIALYADSIGVACSALRLATLSGGTVTPLGDDLSSLVPADLTRIWTEVNLEPGDIWGALALPYTDRADMEDLLAIVRGGEFGIAAKFENTGTDAAYVYIDAVQQGACVQRGYPDCTYDVSETKAAGTADGDTICECSTGEWALPGSVYAGDEDENNSAQVTLLEDEVSCWLVSKHHDFELDASAIGTVTVRFLAKASVADSVVVEGVKLSDGTELIGDDQSPTDIDEALGTEFRWFTLGFTVPLWGLTSGDILAIVNEIGFGVALQFQNNGSDAVTVWVNKIDISICYTAA